MLTQAENDRLTRTGPNTAMGAALRAYWMPALLVRELPTPDCPPVRVRLLGEDFVAFRDSRGQPSILEARCPHRGAELFFGRNEDCGLRCVYHGWKFNAAGECVEIPTLPAEQAELIKPRAHLRSLPVAEAGDVLWAWLGEGEPQPLPRFEFMEVPPEQRFVSKKFQQCNWAQAVEGGLDTAHFSWLHAGVADGERVSLMTALGHGAPGAGVSEPPGVARFRWLVDDPMPQFTVLDHDSGLLLCAARDTDDDQLYYRCTQFMMPNHSLAPGSFHQDTHLGNTWVPVDDHGCWIFCYAWHPEREIGAAERERLAAGAGIFAEVDEHYMPIRRRENDYLIDREAQRTRSYTGIDGISEQDQAIADSQGFIVDRTRELLGQTDLGVVRFRRAVLSAADDVAAGRTPLGADDPDAYLVRSGDLIGARDADLHELLRERFGAFAGGLRPPVPLSRRDR